MARASSSSLTRQWKYDVFLSFNSEDRSFASELYDALAEEGIKICRDDDIVLDKETAISSKIFTAIENSRFSVIILSKKYAFSDWCLEKLAKIVECQNEIGQTILPVFLDVCPSEVGNQTGKFGEAFELQVEYFEENLEVVKKLRAALIEVSNIPGWTLHHAAESEVLQVIEDIVNVISNKSFPSIGGLIGMVSRVGEITSYLKIGGTDVLMIGICGMSGIGKTTIARVVYDTFSDQFEGCSFLANVGEVAQRCSLHSLQEKLLSDIIERDIRISDIQRGVNEIKNLLHGSRILLVLDGVSQLDQLAMLAGECDWFGPGSRIIITTVATDLLTRHGVDRIYIPKPLNKYEALYLFSLKCFVSGPPSRDYVEMSNDFLNYAAGLPLVIEILGSFLFNRNITEWKNILDKLEVCRGPSVLNILQIIFDGLDETEKEVFLDIACFFNGEDKDCVVEILEFLYTGFELRNLIAKSLVRVSSNNQLWMHDQLQLLGKAIVNEAKEPGKCSRLWTHEDIDNVLKENTGTEAVQGIVLDFPVTKVVHWNPEAFSKMCNLRLLKIRNVQLPDGLTCLPKSLRFVEWNGYPLKSLPPDFQPVELFVLKMCRSKIKHLWRGIMYWNNLRVIKLSHSRNLVRTPDFTGVTNIERINLEGCTNLIEVHPSIGLLKRLILLNLKDCKGLRILPHKIGMESLEILILSGCSKVKKIPEFAENMQRLQKLFLDGTAINFLPPSIEHLNGLTSLNLRHCKNLQFLPSFLHNLKSLTELSPPGIAEPETNLISLENKELLSLHGTKVTEKEGGMSLHKKEIKTVPSQTKEGQMKSKLKKKVGDPIEPHTPVAVSTSGASKVEPILLGSSEVAALVEPEIQPNSLEKRVLSSVHGTEAMEKEARMSILETEIEVVPSQPKEGQMRFKSTKHVGEPTEPPTPLEVSISGTSKEATVEPVTILRSGIDGSQPINEEQIEILRQTDGQQFLERTCPKRSIERTLTTILGYMSDVKARRVGVYGSGGIGKTSVLKALINYPTTKDLFDVVIWVTVSRNWSTRKIQDKVLQQLQLSAGDFKTDFELAEELFLALMSQRFLLLLDDVWEWIDLNAIGIPDPTYENGCRMILATRSPDVCHIMVADRKVQVEGLLLEEAWELFREQVGGIIDSPNIYPYAQAIVKKCHGLPLLIIVTGRALAKENDALNWMHASRKFLWLSAHGIYGFEGLIQQLKFSYDRLESPELKSCFLYCVLLPEDREVGIVKLVEYWIEEGLVAGNWTDSYKRGCDIVNILVDASLLQKLEGGLSIKMHDLIRDLALGILSLETEGRQFLLGSYSRMTQLSHMGNSSFFRPIVSFKSNQPLILEDHQFLSRAGAGLTELPLKEKWEEAKMIFLMDNELSSLPDSPSCPKLLALFLQRNQKLRVIPTSFFDLMPSLTVLNLSKTRIKSLPKSLCKLMSLEVLILRDCERLVLLPSEVGSLRRLEVLDLKGTEINKLPNKISELSSLIYLKVSFYGSVNWSEYAKLPHELVSRGIIANLVELETLSIDVYPGDRRWNKNVKSVIDEVGKLTNLTSFCCYFPEVEFLERFLATSLSWKIGGLTEFKFVVGHDVKRFVSKVVDNLAFDNVPWDQCLRFVNGEVIPDAAVEVLTRTAAFYLDHHINVCSLSEFGVSNLDGLRLCVVRECPKIETIIASKELSEAVFPILEHLSINYLSNLSTILEGMIPPGSFAKLRILTVHTCPKLQFVFASSMLHFFSNLEELIVEDCPAITEIIYQDLVVDSGSGTLPSLKKLKLHYLPRLVNIMKGKWPPLENISFYDCPILKKLGIDFIASHTIKGIKAENDWWKELEWQDTSFHLRLQAHFTPICDDDL